MTESFNVDGVQKSMNKLNALFSDFAQKLDEINKYINEQVNQSPDSAVYGELGSKLLNTWNQNASTFGDFYANFENWSAVVSIISANNCNFTKETIAKYKDTGATLEGYHDPKNSKFSKDFAKILEKRRKSVMLENKKTDKISIDTTGVDPNSKVGQAIKKYKDEIKAAEYATITKDFFSITYKKVIDGQEVLVTHIVVNSGSQVNGAPANGSYGSGLEKTSSASSRLNAKYAINGSHFLSSGQEDLQGANRIVIVDGQVKVDGVSGGQELLLYKDGTIGTAAGVSASELVNRGVKYTFSCHSTQMIQNGDTSPSYRETKSYKRTCIGQTANGDYYITTDLGYGNKLSSTAEYLKSLGCVNANSLDQGGSVTLTRNSEVINNPSDSSGERYVGDFLYFV